MPDLDSINEWLKTTVIYGLGFTFLACVCGLLLRLGWIAVSGCARVALIVIEGVRDLFTEGKTTIKSVREEHKSFLSETKTNSARHAAAMELVSESTKRGDSKTHRALGHISTAMHMETNNPVVKSELQHAINLLRSE